MTAQTSPAPLIAALTDAVLRGGEPTPDWLEEVSKLIGEHDLTTRSTSSSGSGWGQRSVSHATRRQRILDVSDLHALPRGRMVVYATGAPARARPHRSPGRTGVRRRDPRVDRLLEPRRPHRLDPHPPRPAGADPMTTPTPGPVDDPVADLNALLGQLAGDLGGTPPTTDRIDADEPTGGVV